MLITHIDVANYLIQNYKVIPNNEVITIDKIVTIFIMIVKSRY